jgi:hypothetical protein
MWGGPVIYGGLILLMILVIFVNKEALPNGSTMGFPNKKSVDSYNMK